MPEELFDRADDYDEMLQRGLALSGEDKEFFIRRRIDRLRRLVTPDATQAVLDFGCGVGDASPILADAFNATVVGVDVAEGALEKARVVHEDERLSFGDLSELDKGGRFDLCYVNGAFHHIPVPERAEVTARLWRSLRPGGYLALFENNPFSPAARVVMKRIPFDRDAVMVWPKQATQLLRTAGFDRIDAPYFLFIFPKALGRLRPIEDRVERMPFGAQYLVLARRPS